jgi:hypothetical protein
MSTTADVSVGDLESTAAPDVVHRGGCHCGAVAFEVSAPAVIEVLECNCSVCVKTGYLHLIVDRAKFQLIRGADKLLEYRFNTNQAQHFFCRVCGIKSFYVPRSHPEGLSVHARCIEPGTVTQLILRPYDGRNWEAARAALP